MPETMTIRPGVAEKLTEKKSEQRIHGLDALRAVAMLLGVLLHGVIAYKEHRLPNWPYDNSFHHWSFDFSYFFIHSFRMALFFVVAGYFCRFLYYKIGQKEFIKHRSKRILIPFIASMIIILPFTIFPFLVYNYSNVYPGEWNKIFNAAFRQLFHWNGIAHLWFLYYLVLYYAATIVLVNVMKSAAMKGIAGPLNKIASLFQPSGLRGVLLAVIPVAGVLIMLPELFPNVDTGLVPALPYLLFYAIFFGIGWVMHKMPNPFDLVMKHCWLFLALGLALTVGLFIAEFRGYFEGLASWKFMLIKLLGALQVICIVYGFIGFFLSYCKSASKTWRYISDASYWMYLIHLGLIAGLQVAFNQTPVIGFLRFLLILFITVSITLITYRLFVRFSVIGNYLHGKRKSD
jgi:glucans biosynthesis protein C